MNRIRKYGNTWQVLLTPTQNFNAGFEILRASFSIDDQYLRTYKVLNFNSLADAQVEAFKYPDLDWDNLILLNENAYIDLKKIIFDILKSRKFIVQYEPRITNSLTLKNIIFDRVIKYGKRFNQSYQMNDIFSFNIINPWSKNLKDIAFCLASDRRLRIIKMVTINNVTTLIGKTEVDTTYEICLWPTLIYNWAVATQHDNSDKIYLNKILNLQKTIDNTIIIR